ncbi:hypothetical protein EMIHUDRAFT_444208, partial [Emiliania huxleyi CCMP1516]|uniref:Uncharacterized protein n=2 Tax=Emiliania huxleyi TaxID=2903 RepID=A0A0D3JIA1_EMIH1
LRRCSPFTVAPFTRRCSSHSPSPSTADAKGRVATAAAGVQPSDAGCADALHRHDVCRPAPHSPSAHAPEQPDAARDERQAALGGSGEPRRLPQHGLRSCGEHRAEATPESRDVALPP